MTDEVLIVGGGIAGSAVALFLTRAGIPCAIFESYGKPAAAGGGIQLAPNGLEALEKLSLSQKVMNSGTITHNTRFYNHTGRKLCILENAQPEHGFPCLTIARRDLLHVLQDALSESGVPIYYDHKLESCVEENGSLELRFAHGKTFNGKLVIGADGVHSRVRTTAVEPGVLPQPRGILNFGGFSPAASVANIGTDTHMSMGLNGFFGYARCSNRTDEEVMWWANIPEASPRLSEAMVNHQLDLIHTEIGRHFANWHMPVGDIVASNRNLIYGETWELPILNQWHKGRAVLIGDAAHAMDPSAGQGASTALEDAYVLVECLREWGLTGEACSQYESFRRDRVQKISDQAAENANFKKKIGPGRARVRDLFFKFLMPYLNGKGNDWIYDYSLEDYKSLGKE